MCIISMERSGGGVAASKRKQERSYHLLPHSLCTGERVTMEGSLAVAGRWWGARLDFGPHSIHLNT